MYIKKSGFGYYTNLAEFPSQNSDKVFRDLELLKGKISWIFAVLFFFFNLLCTKSSEEGSCCNRFILILLGSIIKFPYYFKESLILLATSGKRSLYMKLNRLE